VVFYTIVLRFEGFWDSSGFGFCGFVGFPPKPTHNNYSIILKPTYVPRILRYSVFGIKTEEYLGRRFTNSSEEWVDQQEDFCVYFVSLTLTLLSPLG